MGVHERTRLRRPRAVLLDFYGTVVAEDDAPIAGICRRIAEASPLSPEPDQVGACWGQEFGDLCEQSYGASFRPQRELERLSLRRVLERFGADLDCDALSGELYEYWMRPAALPEARSVLARCDVPVCLVSNIDNADLLSALGHTELPFDAVVTSENCRAYKPRPEMFAAALSLLGMRPEEVLHVGDSIGSDVRGARAAGIPVLWINRKRKPTPSGDMAPDFVSNDLTGLLAAVEGE